MKQQQALVLTDQLISLVSDNSEKQKLLLSLKSQSIMDTFSFSSALILFLLSGL